MIKAPLPPTIELGPLQISLYGLLVGIGAVTILETLGRKFKEIKTIDYILLGLFALIGGKALYLFSHIDSLSYTGLLSGGFRIYGVIIGLVFGVMTIAIYRKVSRIQVLDALFLVFPLTQALGRIGNFLNNELYGKPTELAFGLDIPLEKRLVGYEEYSSFHPLFAYEMILNLLNWFLLYRLSKKKGIKKGTITAVFLVNYGIIRLLMNSLRLDLDYVLDIEVSSFLSVFMISIGGVMIFTRYYKSKVRKKVAKFFSFALNPILTLPLPIFLATFTIGSTNWKEIFVTLLAILGPIPVFLVLKKLGKVSNIDVSDRKQRPLFLSILTILFWIAYSLGVSWGLVLLSEILLVLLFLTLFILIITTFWKISGHMTFLIYSIVSLYVLYDVPELLYLLALVPILSWSRVELKRHTISQVVVGSVTAFIITAFLYAFI